MAGAVRAVLLDAGHTLVFIDPARTLEAFREAGLDVSEERFRSVEREARRRLSSAVEDGATGTEEALWKAFFHDLFGGCGVPESVAPALGTRLMEVHDADHLWSGVDDATPAALQSLLDAGYRLAVISNADGRMEALLEVAGLRGYFEFVLDSDRVGVAKPDPAIFRMAVERLGVDPAECLYVGDLYPVDVVGARAAGLQAVLLDPFDRGERWPDVDRIGSVAELPAYLGGADGSAPS